MPNTRYKQLSWKARVKDYPFTHAVALGMLISAIIFAWSWGIDPVGSYMGLVLVSFAAPATLLILLGLQWRGQVIIGYGIEQTGHWLAVGAWAVNLWLLIGLGATSTLVTPLIFAIAHALRARRLRHENKQIRDIVREAANGQRKVGVVGD